jgi:hypothetical protein
LLGSHAVGGGENSTTNNNFVIGINNFEFQFQFQFVVIDIPRGEDWAWHNNLSRMRHHHFILNNGNGLMDCVLPLEFTIPIQTVPKSGGGMAEASRTAREQGGWRVDSTTTSAASDGFQTASISSSL